MPDKRRGRRLLSFIVLAAHTPRMERNQGARIGRRALFGAAAVLALARRAGAAYPADRDLAIGLALQPTAIDPHFHDSQINRGIVANIFDRLVHQDAEQRPVPGLATSWRALDARRWEFTLRRDVRFHDGSPFAAADVAASFRRAPNVPNSPSSFGLYLRGIAALETPDEFTVRIATREPNGLLPLEVGAIAIIPREFDAAATEDFSSGRAMIGTGPFRFASWRPGEQIDLAANPSYWGGAPAWSGVRLDILTPPQTRVTALVSGRVQVINAVPPSALEFLARDPRARLVRRVSNQLVYLQVDSGKAVSPFVTDGAGGEIPNPLRDRRVRRALSLAINRAALAERLLAGMAVPAASPMPEGRPQAGGRFAPPRFDPDEARRLLEQAGHGDGFVLTLHGSNESVPGADAVLQAIAAMLARVGIAARVETLPRAIFLSRAGRGELSVAIFPRSFPTGEPSTALRAVLATPDPRTGWGGSNRSGYSNPAFDALIARAVATADEAAREALLFEATRLAMDDVAMIPLYHPVSTWALHPGLSFAPRADDYTLAADIRP